MQIKLYGRLLTSVPLAIRLTLAKFCHCGYFTLVVRQPFGAILSSSDVFFTPSFQKSLTLSSHAVLPSPSLSSVAVCCVLCGHWFHPGCLSDHQSTVEDGNVWTAPHVSVASLPRPARYARPGLQGFICVD